MADDQCIGSLSRSCAKRGNGSAFVLGSAKSRFNIEENSTSFRGGARRCGPSPASSRLSSLVLCLFLKSRFAWPSQCGKALLFNGSGDALSPLRAPLQFREHLARCGGLSVDSQMRHIHQRGRHACTEGGKTRGGGALRFAPEIDQSRLERLSCRVRWQGAGEDHVFGRLILWRGVAHNDRGSLPPSRSGRA